MRARFPILLPLALLALWPAAGLAQFYPRDGVVQDLAQRLDWMRCSVGQQWQAAPANPDENAAATADGRCLGEVRRISHAEVAAAAAEAEALHGPGWRLPTRRELESLLCPDCPGPLIRADLFPDTSPEPYWTSDRNFMAPRNALSVNFMTGHVYGRFFPEQQLAVRLVRER